MPKFAKTFCSQCGQEFGPGDHGFSHCSDHQGKIIGQSGILTPEARPFPDKLRSAAKFLRDCHDNLDAREADVIARKLEEAAAELERARGADFHPDMLERLGLVAANLRALGQPELAGYVDDALATLTASPPAQDSAFSNFIRNASPEEKERVYQGVMERAAERQKAVEAGVEERWNKADHHASCHPTDSSLVWQCGQCGHVAAADDVDAHIAGLTARLREMGERGDYWFDLYQREGADHLNDIQRLEQLERDREALLGFVQGFADEPCVYGDNCPPFVKLNHGQCLNCKARAALSAREGGK
jgi:hypothetical protein